MDLELPGNEFCFELAYPKSKYAHLYMQLSLYIQISVCSNVPSIIIILVLILIVPFLKLPTVNLIYIEEALIIMFMQPWCVAFSKPQVEQGDDDMSLCFLYPSVSKCDYTVDNWITGFRNGLNSHRHNFHQVCNQRAVKWYHYVFCPREQSNGTTV